MNYRPSFLQLMIHLCLDGLLFAAIFFLLKDSSWTAWTICQVLVPILMFRGFALMHDAVHGSLSDLVFLNNGIGVLAGAVCFLPFAAWRKIHLQHHLWAGNIDQDPTMKIVKDVSLDPTKKRSTLDFAWRSWIPLLGFMQHVVFWTSALAKIRETRNMREIFWMAASYVVPITVYIFSATLLVKLIPALLIYLCMVEVINFPHHLELPQFKDKKRLPVAQQNEISRSCHYPLWFSYFCLNNFNLHTEHHLFPSLPWYRLHKIRPQVKEALGLTYNESHRSSWILKNRKRKVLEVLIFDRDLRSSPEKVA